MRPVGALPAVQRVRPRRRIETARTAASLSARPGSVCCVGIQNVSSASAEGNDAANRIVGGDAYCDAIARNHLDSEAAHPAAELSEHLVALVALHAI